MRKFFNIKTVYVVAAIIVAGIVMVVWITDRGPIWVNGMGQIAHDIDRYYNKAYPVEGEYDVAINLSDLEGNEGTVLFDDGDSQIYISEVVHNESNYEVVFRSSGTFNSTYANLVSGIEYGRDQNSFTYKLQAEAQATYRDATYQLHSSDSPGLNHRDGDEFGFYLSSANEESKIDLEEESIINVSVKNLFVNLWRKKSSFN